MLVVETIARIRRAYFVQGKAIEAICRELKVSRKVVRKVIRSGDTEFVYERRVQPQPKLGSWRGELDKLLTANAARPARERLTVMRLFEELRGLGYAGGYDAVRRYAARWRRQQSASTAVAFVPLSFTAGEAYQFDWSHEIVVINGATTIVKVAHMRLCHSRMPFVRAYPRETQEPPRSPDRGPFGSGLDRLADDQGSSTPTTGRPWSTGAFFKGACTRGIYDNMKTAVDAVFARGNGGKDRAYNRRFLRMCGHYLVEPVACTPGAALRGLLTASLLGIG